MVEQGLDEPIGRGLYFAASQASFIEQRLI